MLLAGPSQSSFHQYSSTVTVGSDSSSRESSRDASSAASIITISSTSSAASTNSRFSFVKSMVNRGTELLKQTVQHSLLAKLTPSVSKDYAKKRAAAAAAEYVAPTPSSGSSQPRSDSKCSEHSTDSLQTEINCHFKPIRTVPKTPIRADSEVIRIKGVRPASSRSDICFTPSPSPFKPNDPTTPRRSAFSVVSFISNSLGESPVSISPIAEEPVVKLKSSPKPKARATRKRKPSASPQVVVPEGGASPPKPQIVQKAAPKSRKLTAKSTKPQVEVAPPQSAKGKAKPASETVSKPYALRRAAAPAAPQAPVEEVQLVKVVEKCVAVRRSTRKKA